MSSIIPLGRIAETNDLLGAALFLASSASDFVTGQTILVASHKATNRLLLAYYLGMDLRRYRDRLGQDVACLNILDFSSPTEAKIVTLNDTSHCASP